MKKNPGLLAVVFAAMPAVVYCQSGSAGGARAPADTVARDTVPQRKVVVMQAATVTGRTPPVERKRDRTIINVEASPANAGSTVLEVLERSPGVTVDRNGGISLNGKPGVLVMIDDKLTYLAGA